MKEKIRIVCAIFPIVLIGLFLFYQIPIYYAFFIGVLVNAVFYHVFEKYEVKEIVRMIIRGCLEHKIIYIIVILIGGIVPIWISSGIVPSIVYFGIDLFSPDHFFLIAFIFSSIVSVFIGTALGTITTLGIAILAIGQVYNIPQYMLLGAIVSGTFIADKVSPISGLLNVLMMTTEVEYNKLMKNMMKTFIPVYVLSMAFYSILDYFVVIEGSNNVVEIWKAHVVDLFSVTPILLLVPFIIVFLALFKFNTVKLLFSGWILGILAAFFYQGNSIVSSIKIIFFGIKFNAIDNPLTEILVSGGVVSMVEVILIIMGALALTNIFEETHFIRDLSKVMVESIQSKFQLILKTSIISSLLTIISCDQTLGIIIPSKLFIEKYKKFHLQKEDLARVISDTGVVIAPLMPWNVNVIIFSKVIGLTSMKFILFSFLCYAFPLVTVIQGKIGNNKKMN